MKILAILCDGFEDLEAVASFAILRRAGIKVDIYSLENDVVYGKYGTSLVNVLHLKDADLSEYLGILLPGGPHYKLLEKSQLVKSAINYFFEKNALIAAICAAPTILGKMNLLKGRKYTCFTSMNQDFGGTFIDQGVVTDKNLVTSRSAAASIEFALALLKYLGGSNLEEKVKQEIYY